MILILATTIAAAIGAIAYIKKECILTKKERKELQKWRDDFTNKYQDNAEKL